MCCLGTQQFRTMQYTRRLIHAGCWDGIAVDVGGIAKQDLTGIADPVVVAVVGITVELIPLVRNAVDVGFFACEMLKYFH